MKNFNRLTIAATALCGLALLGCESNARVTKTDAAIDARDGSAESVRVDSDADASNAQQADDTALPAAHDLREASSGPDLASPDALSADASSEAGSSRNDDASRAVDVAGVDVAQSDANPGVFRITVVPSRMLDLVFVIDNSPSMSQKQAKLKAQFPKLIDALKDPIDGTLPDLRLAILDSDLGTGGAYPEGSTCGAKKLPDGTTTGYGDMGKFQMKGAVDCGVTATDALWLEYKQGQPLNYTGDIGSVFSCLAGNLGTMGCGLEHSLQAFEFGLVHLGIGNDVQHTMLRPSAYLGLVFLSDEDDCSAATNGGLFGIKSELSAEAASLRCATRAHACGGVNLSESRPGYPTTQAFEAPLVTCAARTDACPNPTDGAEPTDTSQPTACSALKSIHRMAEEMKALKRRPEEQLLVAGIFGWPLNDSDLAKATYKIAPTPNPSYRAGTTAPETIFDSWPICYDPNHLPLNPDPATGFDATAASWGASTGLRQSAFVDEFGENGLKFSICQPDFSAAMLKIGTTMRKKSLNSCVVGREDNYANCTANYLVPDSNDNLVRDPTTLRRCNIMRTNRPCFALSSDTPRCSGFDSEVEVMPVSTTGIDAGASMPAGTMLEFSCN